MRRFLFRIVSQIGVRYRHSALSVGAAGGVHGGDRLPWLEVAPGQDNFMPLSSLDWQVHVYGDPRPEVAGACGELGLALHCFPWQPAMPKAGFQKGANYLIRPDGYVALADRRADPGRLRQYFVERSLDRNARAVPTTHPTW